MKKILSTAALLLAAMMLVMSFAACGNQKNDKEKSLEGSYRLTDVSGDADIYKDLLDVTNLEIDDEDVGVLTVKKSTAELTFDTDEKTVTFKGADPIPYTFDGDELVIENSSGMMKFEKE